MKNSWANCCDVLLIVSSLLWVPALKLYCERDRSGR